MLTIVTVISSDNVLTETLGFKIFQKLTSLSITYSSFSEPVNCELRLAVFNFLPIFSLICS